MRFSKVLVVLLIAAASALAEGARGINAGSLYDIIPQFAAGGGWKTTITIVNLEKDKSVTWALKVFGADGQPLQVATTTHGLNSIFTGVLAINASTTIETTDVGDLAQGWAMLESSGADDVGAIVIFRPEGTWTG